MNLVGMMACRNEEWILGLSARAALMWCDSLVILNHSSTDGTAKLIREVAEGHGSRVTVLQADGDWTEMQHRQMMLHAARGMEATHLAIVDADEVISGNLLGTIRTDIGTLWKGTIFQLPGYNMRGSLYRCHVNGIWGHRWFSVAFKDDPRLSWSGDWFHHREPLGATLYPVRTVMQGIGGVMHLWGASERRLKAKHVLYKMTETLRWPKKSKAEINQLYNLAFLPSANPQFDQDWRYTEVPESWWDHYRHLMHYVNVDAVPWQEAECRKLMAEFGPERFAGLDLFGICEVEA